jgi:hypothetical protein
MIFRRFIYARLPRPIERVWLSAHGWPWLIAAFLALALFAKILRRLGVL